MRPPIRTLLTAADIEARVNALADEIAPRLQPDVVMITLLTGAFVFAADLARALSARGVPVCLDFMILSSYGSGTTSSGSITTRLDCRQDLTGRQVLLVDDILDTGTTLDFAKRTLLAKGATQLFTCVLLDKPTRRKVPVEVEFIGFQVPDLFVVGYGIDYNEMYRELPYVATLAAP
ncbi:MAG: hypoxanthine phosphoribosyltransferase [Magnetococcales bacterium]|nr:hypoxanthine phosphoribosyltransferase [Magnetococcales bacterium]